MDDGFPQLDRDPAASAAANAAGLAADEARLLALEA